MFSTVMTGVPSTPSSSSSRSVTARCSSSSGLVISQTLRMRSALAASSSVEWKASTSWWGSRLTKPTVSMSMTFRPSGSSSARAVGSSVAKSLSSASTPAWVRVFNRVDFPTLV